MAKHAKKTKINGTAPFIHIGDTDHKPPRDTESTSADNPGSGEGNVPTPAAPSAYNPNAPLARPPTPDCLHEWLVRTLGLHIPRLALNPEHKAPFAYLCHAFFEPPGPPTTPPPRNIALPVIQAQPTPKAAAGVIASYSDRDVVLWANRGGGKTFLGALATLLDLVFKPGIEIRVLGGSRQQSLRMYSHLRSFFSPRRSPLLAELVEGRMSREGLTLINGSQVEILSQSHTAVRGTRVQKLRCDEVELFKPDVWEAAQFVTKSKQCGEVYVHGAIECLSTMHLPFGLMHKLVEECGAERRQLFKWGVVDVLEHCTDAYVCTTTNAAGFVENCKLLEECGGRAKGIAPPGGHFVIADAIAQKGRVCEAAWESEMMCVRPSRSDSVIPEFDPKIHVRAFTVRDDCIEWNAGTGIVERRRIMHWTGGMDFGGRSPTVMLWVALDDRNTLWVCDEHVKARWFFEDHMAVIDSGNAQRCSEDGLLAWPRPEYLAVDPAGKADSTTGDSGAVTLLTRRGYDVRAPSAHVKPGLALVRARFAPADLSPPRLFVHERCRHTIESLVLYHYKKEDIDGVTPVKDGNDHCVDALRYLVWSVDKNVAVVTSNYIRP